MVDFSKKLKKAKVEKKVDPLEIYENLDREHDKGPLRKVQKIILKNWASSFSEKKDVILKLHTGQGKTLIGLLILQSKLNSGNGPCLYLCPNNFLVEQTRQQAKSFGIDHVLIKDEIPEEFINGEKILITNASKLFNGLTKFKLGNRALNISSIILDDAHSCIETLKKSVKIKLSSEDKAYDSIRDLFEDDLSHQGEGSLEDLLNGQHDVIMAVPYWSWQEKKSEVIKILSKNKDINSIRFAWPLIKDNIGECRCIISANAIEITPYILPLHEYASYYKAKHRVFMSATVNDDSFLIKGLGIDISAINNPLKIKDEKWSGEKLILIPSLIDETLDKLKVTSMFARPPKKGSWPCGVVALVPSFALSRPWAEYGSIIANTNTIEEEINNLKEGKYKKALVVVNRYDGIDLPDNTCRVLIFSSCPYSESLDDNYEESCRPNSETIIVKTAQKIEQGLGRAVRGEKDYCTVIIIGEDLVKMLKSKRTRQHFSSQTRMQIEIGFEVAKYANEEVDQDVEPSKVLVDLLNQQLKREDGWKEFYKERMNSIKEDEKDKKVLRLIELEKKANEYYSNGEYHRAKEEIQKLIDKYELEEEEKGWYLQEMARFLYPVSKTQANELQLSAIKKNKYLLKPRNGVKALNLKKIHQKRVESIIDWIKSFDSYEELKIELDDLLSRLQFFSNADKFEAAVEKLGNILGFISQRPEKISNEGPDNLWKIKDNYYLLIECKNNVDPARSVIYKSETGQMNNSCAWFVDNYGDAFVKRVMIIPTKTLAKGAGFNNEVQILRKVGLKKIKGNVVNFYKEFIKLDFNDLSPEKIQTFLSVHKLDEETLLNYYFEPPKSLN